MTKELTNFEKNKLDPTNKAILKDAFELILSAKVPSSQLNSYVKENFGDELTHMELIAIGQVLKAQNERDTAAAVFIRDSMGQKAGDKHEISGSKENPFVISLEGDLDKWAE